jgi:ATP-dependent DNA helicase RecG
MDTPELLERIARWEDLHTEFKELPVHPDDLAAALMALANTDGGQLIVGVAQDRSIAGVADPDKVTRDVDNISQNNCEPPITVIQEVLIVRNKSVVVINIAKGDQRPYRTNRGVYYVRTTSGRRQASREELLRLFQGTESFYYDEISFSRLQIGDLDFYAVDHYLRTTSQADLDIDKERLLTNWRLLSNGHPTLAGLLLFGRDPQRHLPYAQVNAARFPGTDGSGDPLDVKELKGQLLDVVQRAEEFLRLHLLAPHVIRGFEPEEKPELPVEALREAVVNAIAHRDYTVHAPIRLLVFDDRIEVHTPGRAPNTVTEEAMRAGIHVVRNPHIYSRLADAGLVTRAGSGIRRMIRLVREATGSDIAIALRDYEVLITLPRKKTGSH